MERREDGLAYRGRCVGEKGSACRGRWVRCFIRDGNDLALHVQKKKDTKRGGEKRAIISLCSSTRLVGEDGTRACMERREDGLAYQGRCVGEKGSACRGRWVRCFIGDGNDLALHVQKKKDTERREEGNNFTLLVDKARRGRWVEEKGLAHRGRWVRCFVKDGNDLALLIQKKKEGSNLTVLIQNKKEGGGCGERWVEGCMEKRAAISLCSLARMREEQERRM